MYARKSISGLLYASYLCVGSLAAVVPPCNDTINTAGGGIPNNYMPSSITASAINSFQLALFLENLEVSFFRAGLANMTKWNTSGYPNDTIEVITTVVAQEDIHRATITNLLESYNRYPVSPCNYTYPINSIEEFFELADLITSVGIGATIGLSERLAITDPLLIQSVSSILTIESRHDAFFRHIQGKSPNPSPFDTGISDIWAYNLALSFIVPGSCETEVPLPILPSLNVTDPTWSNATQSSLVEFQWDPTQMTFVVEGGKELFIGWINQLDTPVYSPLNITRKGTGTAAVPFGMSGAVFAVVTTQQPDNTNDLSLATLAGPVVMNY